MPDDFLKLTIQLTAHGDRMEVRSSAPDAGEAKSEVALPSLDLYEGILQNGEAAVGQPALRTAGKRLFACLKAGQCRQVVDDVFHQSLRLACPIHIELRFDPDQVTLARLPWELLTDDNDQVLILNRIANVTRYITYPQAPPRLHPTFDCAPLLRVIARPSGLPPFSPSELPVPKLLTLPNGTFEALEECLLIERLRVWGLHFDGHGWTDLVCECGTAYEASSLVSGSLTRCPSCGASPANVKIRGLLAFEGDPGVRAVTADELGAVLYNSGTYLATLLACRSAHVGGSTIFGGLAPRLILAGVPAVVGMQSNVPDAFANRFAKSFYLSLLKHRDVLVAMQMAQLMTSDGPWYSPVLYLREAGPQPHMRSICSLRHVDTATPQRVSVRKPFLARLWLRRPETPALSDDQLKRELNISSDIPLSTRTNTAAVIFKKEEGDLRFGEVEVRLTATGCEVAPGSIPLFVYEAWDAPNAAIFTVQINHPSTVSLIFSVFQERRLVASIIHHVEAVAGETERELVTTASHELPVGVATSIIVPSDSGIGESRKDHPEAQDQRGGSPEQTDRGAIPRLSPDEVDQLLDQLEPLDDAAQHSLDMADRYRRLYQLDVALGLCWLAVEDARRSRNGKAEATCRLHCWGINYLRHDYEEARLDSEEARRALESVSDVYGEITALTAGALTCEAIGHVHRVSGRRKRSAAEFRAALRMYEEALDMAGEETHRLIQSRSYDEMQQYEETFSDLQDRFHRAAEFYATMSTVLLRGITSAPVVGAIAAGKPRPTLDDVEDYLFIGNRLAIGDNLLSAQALRPGNEDEIRLDPEEFFYFVTRVKGDSMDACDIDDGDYVLIQASKKTRLAPITGDIVAAVVKDVDRQATLKRYIEKSAMLILQPESKNPANVLFEFTPRQWENQVTIVGIAIAVLKVFQPVYDAEKAFRGSRYKRKRR